MPANTWKRRTNLTALFLQTGTVNGPTPVIVDVGINGVQGGYPGAVQIVLNSGFTYVMSAPPAYPTPPSLTGNGNKFYPGVSFGPGSVLGLLAPEAKSLVALGAATVTAYL